MNKKVAILGFYAAIAAICAAVLVISMSMRKRVEASRSQRAQQVVINTGRETRAQWFPIKKDLSATNQDNQPVELSDLRGKVWVIAEFFAVCPKCAARNGSELRALYDAFRNHPDFHVVCVSVDPENDKVDKLADYAKALGADTSDWWFLNAGDIRLTHEYLENELGFMGIRERTDPLDIESNGRYAHDMAFTLIDRDFNVVGKWNVTDAGTEIGRKLDSEMYDRSKSELYSRIRTELGKAKTTAN